MFAYELPLEPPVDYWEEYEKPKFILSKIQEICADIMKRGDHTNYQEIFDLIYEHIDDKISKFYPEADYDLSN